MIRKKHWLFCCVLVSVCLSVRGAESTLLSYHGTLNDHGAPANGIYDFTFGLYTTAAYGAPVGSIVTSTGIAVTNGSFSVELDFSNVFDGTIYWLETAVRTNNATNAFTTLLPRQKLAHTPYAVHAISAVTAASAATSAATTGQIADSQLSTNIARLSGDASFSGTITANSFNGNGAGLTNLAPTALPAYLQNPTVLSAGAGVMATFVASNRPVRILCLGDSMSEYFNHYSASAALIDRLVREHGYGGQAFYNIDANYLFAGPDNPILAGHRPETLNPHNPIFPLFFTWILDLYPDGIAGKAVQVRTNAINQLGVWWYATPKGGTIRVATTNTPDGGRVFTLNGYAQISTVFYTNWPVTPSSDNTMYLSSISGTNIIIGTEFLNTIGPTVEYLIYAQGGSGVLDMAAPGIGTLDQFFNTIKPDLVLWHGVNRYEENDTLYQYLLTQILLAAQAGNTNCPVVIIGCPSRPRDNPLRMAVAAANSTNNFFYLDLPGQFPDIYTMFRAGMLYGTLASPDVHPTFSGATAWGNEIHRQLGF